MADPIPQIFIGPQDPTQSGWGGTFPPSPAGDQYVPYTGADVAALLQQPPGYTTNPVTGDTVGPSPNPQTPVPGSPLPNPPQPPPAGTIFTDMGYFGGILGGWGPAIYRRTRRLTKTGRLIRDLETVGLRAIFNTFRGRSLGPTESFPGSGEAAPGIGTELMRHGIPPPAGPGYAAQVGAFFRGVLPYGRATGWLAMLYPRSTASNDTVYQDITPLGVVNDWTAQMVRDQEDELARRAALAEAPRGGGQDIPLQSLNRPPVRDNRYAPTKTGLARIFATVEDWEKQFNAAFPGEIAPIRVGRKLQGGEYDPGRVLTPGELRKFPQVDATGSMGSESTSTTTSPATPATVSSHTPLGIFKRIPGLPLALGLGGIAATAIVLSGRRSGGGTPSFVAPPLPITTPSQNVTPQPQTGVQALLVGGYQSGSVSTDCGCGPRGPRRKCLERAPVTWRSGRNKGKAAGSKCVRYAQRAS